MCEQEEMFDVPPCTELFDGDTGTLPDQARRVAVKLFRDPYISAEKNPDEWLWLKEHREAIKSSLNDLFLDLYLDERNEVAYAMAPEGAPDDLPRLKKEHRLNDIQSLLIVFLRQQYASQTASGSERVWVDAEDIHAYLERLNAGRLDTTKQAAKTDSAIEFMKSRRYLEKVAGQEARYRIMPIVESVFSLDKALTLLDEYERAARERRAGIDEANECLVDEGIEDAGVKTEGE